MGDGPGAREVKAMAREARVSRSTRETEVEVALGLDGGGVEVSTGVGFMDHMLTLLAVHGGLGLEVRARGDLHVDAHHTVEDVGICLGRALKEALDGYGGIARYGSASVPMEESLARVDCDLCGRPYLVFNARFPVERVGGFDTELVEEFLRAVVVNGGVTLHVNLLYGRNGHHMIEAIFKALGRALAQAVRPTEEGAVLSSKGVLG